MQGLELRVVSETIFPMSRACVSSLLVHVLARPSLGKGGKAGGRQVLTLRTGSCVILTLGHVRDKGPRWMAGCAWLQWWENLLPALVTWCACQQLCAAPGGQDSNLAGPQSDRHTSEKLGDQTPEGLMSERSASTQVATGTGDQSHCSLQGALSYLALVSRDHSTLN